MDGKINRSMEGGKKRRNGRAIQRHTWKEEQRVKRGKGVGQDGGLRDTSYNVSDK